MLTKQIHRISAGLVAFSLGGMLLSQKAACQAERIPVPDSVKSDSTKADSAKPDSAKSDSAKSAKQPTGSGGTQSDDPSYVIGEDDILGVYVLKEPDLKQSVPVRPDGKISLPLIGDIQAAGRTPGQLEEAIVAKLQTYITHPDVTVIVQEIKSKKFNILGRVRKPGAYPLSTATTVLDAIALAGGFQDFAKQKDICILRENPDRSESRLRFNYKAVILGKNPEQNITLAPNDTIVVP